MTDQIDLDQINASKIQQILFSALRDSKNLANEPDNFLHNLLAKTSYTKHALQQATSAIYREIYYQCSKDLHISQKESNLLDQVIRLLDMNEDIIVELDYEVGLMIYKRTFRKAVADGEMSGEEQHHLENIAQYFQLKKTDIRKAISNQALAYYSFLLAEALNDGFLSENERVKLVATVNRYGLTKKQLKTLTIPNKKEILSSALATIKASGQIREEDSENIRELADFLNAKELLDPCLKDLDLYSRIFEINRGNLPTIEDHSFILNQGEKLHYAIPITYQKKINRKLKSHNGTLYLGSQKMRFVGLHKSHEVRYKNILSTKFHNLKSPKISLSVASGSGGGDYKLKGQNDPGLLFEIQEVINFLIRKANGLEKQPARDTRYIPADVRSEVWYRDGGRCVFCGADAYLEFDHIIPLSKGGATSIDNLQILCRNCNSEKKDSI